MNSIRKVAIFFIAFIALTACKKESKNLTVAPLFTNNMVIQANKPVNVWGTSIPGSEVTVQVREQSKTVKANDDGSWILKLDAESYGNAGLFTIKSSNDSIVLKNAMYGEVWLCSGQSNMEMPLVGDWAHVNNCEQEAKNANYPEIRLFTVDKAIAFQPIDAISTKGWLICDSNSVKDFSATAYFFGRKLYQELNVPIGLIHSSWGGTVAEAWTSRNSLMQMDDFAEQASIIASITGSQDKLKRKYEADMNQMLSEILIADEGYDSGEAIYADIDRDDSDWMPIDLPKMWEETDLGVYDGSTWFRKTINMSVKQASQNWMLNYGAPDDWDEAWVNGVKVGEKKEWNVLREYKIPEDLIKAGKNVITLRVYDYTGGGGFMGEAEQYKLISAAGEEINIAEGWLAKKGFDFKDIKTRPVSLNDPNQPTVLYNAMINPLLNMTFQGAIWYQGESNAGRAHQYQSLFQTMIKDWRANFDNGDFPFYYVQLASFLQRNTDPVEDSWAELREAQTMALDIDNTGMAVTIDIGDALDIHPGNKQDVGLRLALNALANTYNKDLDYSGPMYIKYSVKDNSFEIEFEYNQGLSTADGEKLTGFAIAGKDSVFVWADAEIKADKVIVSSPQVKKPIAVRYAWSSNPACNLINNTGLPASPFRTDSWKGITY